MGFFFLKQKYWRIIQCCQHWTQVCSRLCSWPCDGRTFHLTFTVYYDFHMMAKRMEHTVFLWDDFHCRITTAECTFLLNSAFLPWLWSSSCLLHQKQESVRLSLDPLHRDSIQNSGSCAVSTVDHGSYQKTPGNAGFCTGGTTTSLFLHLEPDKKPHCFFFFVHCGKLYVTTFTLLSFLGHVIQWHRIQSHVVQSSSLSSELYFYFFKFKFIYFNRRLITLQYCIGFAFIFYDY